MITYTPIIDKALKLKQSCIEYDYSEIENLLNEAKDIGLMTDIPILD